MSGDVQSLFDGWPPGRSALQRYFLAQKEIAKLHRRLDQLSQVVVKENDAAVAYLKESGPVDITFNYDDTRYRAVLVLGSPALEVKEESGAWA